MTTLVTANRTNHLVTSSALVTQSRKSVMETTYWLKYADSGNILAKRLHYIKMDRIYLLTHVPGLVVTDSLAHGIPVFTSPEYLIKT